MSRPDKQTQLFTTTKYGQKVYIDLEHSHAATHFADTPQLAGLCKDALKTLDLQTETILLEKVFTEPIGVSDLVTNDPGDEILYAKRHNRQTYTSFNKTKAPQPCAVLTIALQQITTDTYELTSAWIGPADSPPFPGDPNETVESKHYWNTHALAWGTQAVQPETITTACPW